LEDFTTGESDEKNEMEVVLNPDQEVGDTD
jgi:hypothetical protein